MKKILGVFCIIAIFSTASLYASERAEYGVGRSEILAERMLGSPITVLASIFQHSVMILMT